jgi:hypothetical protein
MPKLSPAQKRVLDKMEPGVWRSRYGLGCSIATLNALCRKGFVEKRNELPVSLFFPRIGIKYRRIDHGD